MAIQHALPLDAQNWQKNHLLAALPAETMARLTPHLKLVHLPLGKVLYEPGGEISTLYFPTDAIIALLSVMHDGSSAEISVVGNEGVLGVSVFMGADSTPSRAVTQSAGGAYTLPGRALKVEFDRHGKLLELVLHYTQTLIVQLAQTAVCNRYHTIDQQLCRMLLMSLDRSPGNRLAMTQELIANMLGVRREGVTEAAGKLQRLGVISYSRGKIEVLDRPQLEYRCCECYAIVKKEAQRMLPRPVARTNGNTVWPVRA